MLITSKVTDVGIKKPVNQDAPIIKKAYADGADVVFLGVCDGMGGLSNGERASAEGIKLLNEWFENDLKKLVYRGLTNERVEESLRKCLQRIHESIKKDADNFGVDCGTTLSAILLYNGRYATVNIGDSRVYRLTPDGLTLLTHDHSLVQQMVDNGEITPEEAKTHKKRSILLQALGVSEEIFPDFTFGTYDLDDVFLVCSDGFRHKIEENEIYSLFNPLSITDKEDLTERTIYAVDVNKTRAEKDNITVVVAKM